MYPRLPGTNQWLQKLSLSRLQDATRPPYKRMLGPVFIRMAEVLEFLD